jgi:Mg2+-importing ATPase
MSGASEPRSPSSPQATEATLPEVLQRLGVTRDGLSGQEATRRQALYGINGLPASSGHHPLALLYRQFRSPMVLILVGAAILSFALGQSEEAWIVCAIVAASTGLGYYQEYRAGNALAELEGRLAIQANVIRDGIVRSIPAQAVVPGDVVQLKAGSLVVADAVLIEVEALHLDEAALTGESYPAEKSAAGDGTLTQANRVHMGTSVRSGEGLALVTETGLHTEYGRLFGLVARIEPETSFARGTRQFGLLMTQIMLVLVVVVLAVNVLLGRPVLESLLFAAALAVGITPELLPAIVTVTLSQGARRLASRGVLMRSLIAIENLGAMDTLCVDKTGTLTGGELALVDALDCSAARSSSVLQWAVVNARLQTAMPNPLDAAILDHQEPVDLSAYSKLGEAAYDFERKRLSILVEREGLCTLVCKGAVGPILDCCTHISTAEESGTLLTPELVAEQMRRVEEWGNKGLRVLAVATRSAPDEDKCTPEAETGLTLIGYLLFADPLKPDIAATVAALREMGIALRIISGDNRYVVRQVAADVGLSPHVVTGPDLARLSERAFARRVRHATVFAEIAPDQKERIVSALRRSGHTVGYLGDGINDAPALRAADVGISVDNAVDAARAAADVILLQHDLMVLLEGVRTGRHAFANTVKYITITISANLGNMLSMAVASLALPFLPLLASQVLLNNLLSDLPMLAISTDRVDDGMLSRPWRWDFRALVRSMLAFGLVSSLFDGLTFVVLMAVFHADESTFQSAWFLVSLLTELTVVAVMRTYKPVSMSAPSSTLLVSSLAVAAVAVALPFTWLGEPLGLPPLALPLLAVLLAITLAYAAATELLKNWVKPFSIVSRAATSHG